MVHGDKVAHSILYPHYISSKLQTETGVQLELCLSYHVKHTVSYVY